MTRLAQKLFGGDGGLLASVLGGARWSLVYKVSNAFFTFLIAVLAARLLGLDGYGQLQYVLGVLNVVLVFGGLGLAKIIVRETAIGANHTAWGQARGIMRFANIAMPAGTLLLAGFAALAFVLPVEPTLIFLYALGVVAILSRQLAILPTSFMNGLRKMSHTGLSEFLRNLFIAGALAFVWLTASTGDFPVEAVMGIRVVAAIASLIWIVSLYRSVSAKLSGDWLRTQPVYRIAGWLKAGFPLMIVAASYVVFLNADIMMIGLFLGTDEVGVYHAASRVASLAGQAIGILVLPLAPVIASLTAKGDNAALRKLVGRITALALGVALPLSILLIVFSGPLLTLFGPEFDAGKTALQIIVLGQVANVATGPVQALLIMSGRERFAAYAAVSAAILNIALNYLLIPQMGIEGAAIATATGIAVSNLLLFYFVRRHVWAKASANVDQDDA